jgi:hypothetical protein
MRQSVIVATFLVVGAGAAGAGALSSFNMLGSDTLFDVTNDVLANCPGTSSLLYLGTGSGNGENQMKAGSQTIAPMSKMLTKTSCANVTVAGGAADGGTAFVEAGTAAQGLVIGLDGVAIVASKNTSGTAACNGSIGGCALDAAFGVAINTTVQVPAGYTYNGNSVTSYTFIDWRDVLRVVFGGLDNKQGNGGLANNTVGTRNCNSTLRKAIVNNWSAFFEAGASCTGAPGDGTGTCTQLRHVFRRDNASGTSDVFASLLGLVGPSESSNTDAYCNAIPTNILPPNAQLLQMNMYYQDYQDNDPIRRPCAGTNKQLPSGSGHPSLTVPTEQVCSLDGDLGLVLPISPADFLPSVAVQFPTKYCGGVNIFGTAPPSINLTSAATGHENIGSNVCPNGDVLLFGGECLIPTAADGSLDPSCMAANADSPASTFSTTPSPEGTPPGNADGRVYNEHLWAKPTGSATVAAYYTDQLGCGAPCAPFNGRSITGAYWRLHANASMLNPNSGSTCQQRDATDQIGCLVAASPCSIGYAGKEAASPSINPNTVGLLANGIGPSPACISNFSYPLSRKLYLNSIIGFPNINGAEALLAACENTPATINAALTGRNFLALPNNGGGLETPNAGSPFCEDFNEQMLCAGQSGQANVNACANNSGSAFPTAMTTCGNAIVEAFEDCDQGTAGTSNALNGGNGSAGNLCSTTCRFNLGQALINSHGCLANVAGTTCLPSQNPGVTTGPALPILNCNKGGGVTGACNQVTSPSLDCVCQ